MVMFTDKGCVPVIALVLTTFSMNQKEVSLHLHLTPTSFQWAGKPTGQQMSTGDSRFRNTALYSLVLTCHGDAFSSFLSNSTPFAPSSLQLCLHASGPFPELMANFWR